RILHSSHDSQSGLAAKLWTFPEDTAVSPSGSSSKAFAIRTLAATGLLRCSPGLVDGPASAVNTLADKPPHSADLRATESTELVGLDGVDTPGKPRNSPAT